MANLSEGILFGMGNPLLDIQAKVDQAFLDKWSLKANDAILCDDKHIPLFKELSEKEGAEYIPGGATQNSLRVASWLFGKPNLVTFMGCVGDDEYGKTLKQKMVSAGVNPVYQINQKEKTGTCAVCIFEEHRSLCAHLAAANCFTKDHLDAPGNQSLMEKAQFYYISGFFLTVCPDAIVQVGMHAAEKNKHFIMNLSAPFLTQFFKEPMLRCLPYTDIIFGNETEAVEFAKNNDFGTEKVSEIALKLSDLPKENKKRSRMVIITQGAEAVIVAREGKIREFPTVKLSQDDIIDTNGAGDAFVGGFLAQFVQGQPLEECIRCAIWAGTMIIKRSGCSIPDKCEYK